MSVKVYSGRSVVDEPVYDVVYDSVLEKIPGTRCKKEDENPAFFFESKLSESSKKMFSPIQVLEHHKTLYRLNCRLYMSLIEANEPFLQQNKSSPDKKRSFFKKKKPPAEEQKLYQDVFKQCVSMRGCGLPINYTLDKWISAAEFVQKVYIKAREQQIQRGCSK